MRPSAEIVPLRPRHGAARSPVAFDRRELRALLTVYGRMVAVGAWRDYAVDFRDDYAQFAVFLRSSEGPVYRIEKRPGSERRQGAWSLIGSGGRVLRRGTKLERVLGWFDPGAADNVSVLPFGRYGKRA